MVCSIQTTKEDNNIRIDDNDEALLNMFSKEEVEILKMVNKNYVDLTKSMVKNGMPHDNGTIRTLTEVLGKTSEHVLTLGNLRQKARANDINANGAELAAALLMEPMEPLPEISSIERTKELPDDIVDIELDPRALHEGKMDLNPEDYIGED